MMTTSNFKNIKRVLVANRGEIACRVIRTCKEYSLTSIAIYSKEDIESLHVCQADEAIQLSGIGAAAYINIEEIVNIAKSKNVDVVVPGYGFLSENAVFAEKLADNNIKFAGPSSETVEKFGLKHLARKIAIESNVPIVPGTDLICHVEDVIEACNTIGYPIILKATAGGGGMGLKVCYSDKDVEKNFTEVTSRGASLFNHTGVFVEKYIEKARHIEVQLFGNGLGDIATYGERECSIQRRHQKVIEESPSPFVDDLGSQYGLRKLLTNCAKRLTSSVKYKSAGTAEFLVDNDTGLFYFLEVNTRLQVEHGISEMVYGVDLVYLMLLQAEYETIGSGVPIEQLTRNLKFDKNGVEIPRGHAFEVRIYAENPAKDFAPCPGILHNVDFPAVGNFQSHTIRIDHWISTGAKASPYFDPLLAKVMVWSEKRDTTNIVNVLENTKIQGLVTNIEYCIAILKNNKFCRGETLTNFLDYFEFRPLLVEFLEAGTYTTIQDLPGRAKIRTGVPQSGPVDPLSLQIANIVVGNDKNTECLEINMKGPVLKFHRPAVIAIAGGAFEVTLNDQINLPQFTELFIPSGCIVKIGDATGKSSKCYLSLKGGFPGVARYLGSKSCTPGLKLGGHQGRIVFPGDCLEISAIEDINDFATGYALPQQLIPNYEREINVVRMIGGPHDTGEIVSQEGMEQLYSVQYTVNFNSNRGAIRLDGPEMIFNRKHGGDGGGHPSNILEYPYPTGGLSTVGSTLVLFGVDGATLSGFTCVGVPAEVDFWKFGQAKVASPIKFKLITYNDAIELRKRRESYIKELSERPRQSNFKFDDELVSYERIDSKVGRFLHKRESKNDLPYVAFRQAGENMIIIDFGTEKFSLFNNGRQYALQLAMENCLREELECIECSSGAMCITFDPLKVEREMLLGKLTALEESIPPVKNLKVPSRIFRLPLCFEHSALDHCLKRYIHSQRPHAPYLPNNANYLMRANCLETYEHFKKCIVNQPEVVVAVSFLCANPLLVNTDPRLRFLTSKYNPARTSTPAGTIGSGSVSQSIYSVESPGGYMIWGLTLPNWYWDTFCRIHDKPWPLQNFDQVTFYEVSEEELTTLNTAILTKRTKFEPEAAEFDFTEYEKFIGSIKEESHILTMKKREAFSKLIEEEEADLATWNEEIQIAKQSKVDAKDLLNAPDSLKVVAHMAANVFRINYNKGDVIKLADTVMILEAMKMEIAVGIKDEHSENGSYEILENIVDEGDIVNPGDILTVVKRTKN